MSKTIANNNLISAKLRNFRTFLKYTKSYFKRHNPFKDLKANITNMFNDAFNLQKKAKMAKRRLNYQRYRLNKLEQVLAQNSDHVFLKGRTLNRTM